MEVLSSRLLLSTPDLSASRRFYEETLGLRVAREFGRDGEVTGVVYFLGGGFLEVSVGAPVGSPGAALWLQVPDLASTARDLEARGVPVRKPAGRMPWGLDELWILGPDGLEIKIVEVPASHPLRRRTDLGGDLE
jgi:catechol 2,3-dioxygenase-like lactoylglutathione lyase family enzyme